MDLKTYEKLTGKVIPERQRPYYEAQIKRAQSKLENLLGWTLTPKNIYTELGKAQRECVCPSIPETSSLLPPDPVQGIYKVFPYNYKDKYLHTDPFTEVYNVKLVKVMDDYRFITYKTFETYTKQYMQAGIGNHVEKCETCFCNCDCKDCIQLAVDANWVDINEEESLPDDLLYLLCDMVDYWADPYKDIKSESVDGHSWSKGDTKPIEEVEDTKLLLRRYAGPYGAVLRMPTL